MDFKIVISQEQAEKEVADLLDKKGIFPKRREQLTNAIDAVVEGIVYGFVAIADDGTITQTLSAPFDSVTEIKYASRISPETVNKAVANGKQDSAQAKMNTYIGLYTGLLSAQILKLEPSDKNIADSISLFFM